MSLAFAAAILTALELATPLALGDLLLPRVYPAHKIVEAYELLDHRKVRFAPPPLAFNPIELSTPLLITRGNREKLRLALLRKGIFLKPSRLASGRRGLLATQEPQHRGEAQHSFQIAFIELSQATPQFVANQLAEDCLKTEKNIPEKQRTRFVPDPRTYKIAVRYLNPNFMQHYIRLAQKLDTPPAQPNRPVLRHWRCRHLRASALAEAVKNRWTLESGQALNAVAHAGSNSILFRLPKQSWPAVQKLLEQLDVTPRRR